MTNRHRVIKALRGAPKEGRTVAQIISRDKAEKLTVEKVELALDQLRRHALVLEPSDGRYILVAPR